MRRANAIDFWRGFALIEIFINHVPDNGLWRLTHRQFSWSDAGELLVFLAGWSMALRVAARPGDMGSLVASRLMKLYVAHAVVTLLLVGIYWFAQQRLGDQTIFIDYHFNMELHGVTQMLIGALLLTDLLAAAGGEEVARLCHDRALGAPTMTERFDALAVLVDIEHPLREVALEAFAARWRNHPTVLNKWFMAQALSRAPGAIHRIMALQAHPLFKPMDIAMGMAFYGSFFRQNRLTFHEPGGRGYQWLADMLLMLDRLGRPGAVWLIPQIAPWRRHRPTRQLQMREALQRVADTPGISNGLRGLVGRLLGD